MLLYEIINMNCRLFLEKGIKMATSYNKLWKLMIDKNMQKKDLVEMLNLSSATIAKMGKGEQVSMDVLERICTFFNCDIGDIVSFTSNDDARRNNEDEEI